MLTKIRQSVSLNDKYLDGGDFREVTAGKVGAGLPDPGRFLLAFPGIADKLPLPEKRNDQNEMRNINLHVLTLLLPACLLTSACGTTSEIDNHTQLVVSPEARRVVEASQQPDAEEGAAATPKPELASAKNPDQVICRKEPPPSGTRLGARRICATRAEWDDLAESGKEETKRIQDAAKHCIPSTFRPC